jgi:hypothetical protein
MSRNPFFRSRVLTTNLFGLILAGGAPGAPGSRRTLAITWATNESQLRAWSEEIG